MTKAQPHPQSPRTWSEVRPARRSSIPEGLWLRCPSCQDDLPASPGSEPECLPGMHPPLSDRGDRTRAPACRSRLVPGVVREHPADRPAQFRTSSYRERLVAEQVKTGQVDAIRAGRCFIKGREAMLVCLDLTFMMGSMGSVVGETITRAIEAATPNKAAGYAGLPVIIVSCRRRPYAQEPD